MQRIVLVAQGSGGKPFFKGLRFRSGAILVGATNVERPPIASAWELV